MHLRRGTATIVDVIAVTMVLLALIGWCAAAASRSREYAYHIKCASNLKQIGQSLYLYCQTNGEWPRTRYLADGPQPISFTGIDSPDPFSEAGPELNDVTSAYYLLARSGLDQNVFICPLALTTPSVPSDPSTQSNFRESNLSYSFANPYPGTRAVAAGLRYDFRKITAEFAIAADMNPGGDCLLSARPPANNEPMPDCISPNHGRRPRLMNVLYGDGHVESAQNPFFGVQRDNIFTYGGPMKDRGGLGIVGSPVDGNDSVLLPVASAAYWQPFIDAQRREDAAKWTIGIVTAFSVAVVAWFLRFFLIRARAKSALGS